MTPRLADAGALSRHREALVAALDPGRPVVAVCVGTGCRANGALTVV